MNEPRSTLSPAEVALAAALGLDAEGRRLLVAYRERLIAPLDRVATREAQWGCICAMCEARRVIDRARGCETVETR